MRETNFKQTDLGLIPKDWDITKIGELMSISSGETITAKSFTINGKYPVFGGNGVRGYCEDFNLNGEYVLIGRVGALCGNVHITHGKSFASEHALVCRPKITYDNIFVAEHLKMMNLGQYSGASAQPVLAARKLQELPIVYPPANEQIKIGTTIQNVGGFINILKKLIEKKRAIKAGAMSQLLSGKLRLPGFSEPWISTSLDELGDFFKGRGISREEANSGEMPAIRYGEIYTDHNNYIRHFKSYISREVAERSFLLQNGDLCFTASGETLEEIGKTVAFASDEIAYAGGDIIILRPTKEINPIFFGFLLNTPPVVKQKSLKGHGVSIMHIRAKALAEIQVSYPSDLEEQKEIAKVLTDMDEEISALEAKLKKYEQLKKGMMQQLLTGKIRLVSPNESLS